MLLAIDVGNTNIVLGIYENEKLIKILRIRSDRKKTYDEYGIQLKEYFIHFNIDQNQLDNIIISSVVPDITHSLKSACESYFNIRPLVVGENTNIGMNIMYDNPKEVGADRLVNSISAYEKYGGPLIIIDFGTATTHDVIDEKGNYLGGTISPGMQISSDALSEKTAKLPKIDLILPKRVVGKNTVESMQSGIVNGFIGLIDHLTELIIREMNWKEEELTIITTGGYAPMISKNSKFTNIIDQDLTLSGLKIIYERTKSGN